MSCHDFQHNLALLVGEELEVNETIAARRHVAHCPDCREALQQLNDSRMVMRAVSETPAEINGESLWPRLRAQILPATISRPQRDYPSWMPTATLAAACVALLIFVGSTPMLDRDNEPDSFVDESFQRQLDQPTDPLLYSNPGHSLRGGIGAQTDAPQSVGLGFRFPQQQQVRRWDMEARIHEL